MKEFSKVNLLWGCFATIMTGIFGKFWFLFAGFLVMNIIDYVTGTYKAKKQQKINSHTGRIGVFKKVSYWIVIFISFYIPYGLIPLGGIIGIKLDFLLLFGWLTLASYLINEIRSILENFVEMGVDVPKFLIKGLQVANTMIEEKGEIEDAAKGD